MRSIDEQVMMSEKWQGIVYGTIWGLRNLVFPVLLISGDK